MRWRYVVLFVTLTFSLICFQVQLSQAQTASSAKISAEEAINAALDKPIDWEYSGGPLQDVVNDLEKRTGVTFVIDKKSLEEAGVGTDSQLEFHAKSLPVRAGLHLALRELELTWSIIDEAVTITTPDVAESRPLQRVYLVQAPTNPAHGPFDFDTLINTITATIEPDTWIDAGGNGSIEPFTGTLVVTQSQPIQEKIAGLLQLLTHLPEPNGDSRGQDIDPDARAIRPALDRPISIPVSEIPLSDFVAFVSTKANINVSLDRKALEEAGIGTDTQVTVGATDLPLRTVLSRVLHPLDLTWSLRHGVLTVTTPDRAESDRSVQVYQLDGLGIPLVNEPARFDTDGLPVDKANGIESLIEVLTTSINPDHWVEAGGSGDCQALPQQHLLVVSQVEEIHEQIGDFFSRLRRIRRTASATGASAVHSQVTNPVAGPSHLQFVVYKVPMDGNGNVIYTADDLTRLLMKAIEPESWTTEKGVFIEPLTDAIAIRHHASVQTRIQRFLSHMQITSGSGGFGGIPSAPVQNPGGGGFFDVGEGSFIPLGNTAPLRP